MLNDLIVFQKTYDFYVWQKTVIRHLAKVHKYSLGVQLENETLNLLKQIVKANLTRTAKKEEIENCLVFLEIIKVLIRAGHEFNREGGISLKNYQLASEKLAEIGKLLGGWLKNFSGRAF